MTVSWLPEISPLALTVGARGGPEDAITTFDPDVGPPIARLRTTGVAERYAVRFTPVTLVQLQAFRAWYAATARFGALSFVFRHPLTGDVVSARFADPYTVSRVSADRFELEVELLILPATPWFAPYVRDGVAEIPAFVADYDANVFGIGDAVAAASDMPGISGTYDLYTTSDADEETFQNDHVVNLGDISATKPLGIKRYVGFEP